MHTGAAGRIRRLMRLLGLVVLAFAGGALGYIIVTGASNALVLIIIGCISIAAVMMGPRYFGLCILALSALPLFSQSYRVPLIWAAIVVWGFVAVSERLMRRSPRPAASLDSAARWLPAAFFASAVLADLLGAEHHVQDLVSRTLTLAVGLAVYYLAADGFSEPTWHRRALLALTAGAVAVLLLGVQMMVRPGIQLPGMISTSGGTLYRELGRVSQRFAGPLGDYELAAEMLGISSIGFLGVALGAQAGKRVLLTILGSLCLGGILLTGTRGGLVMFAIGMALLLFKRQPLHPKRSFLLVLAIIGIPAACIFAFMPDAWLALDRLALTRFDTDIARIVNRGYVWPSFISTIGASRSILFGNGVEYDYLSIGTYPHSLYLYLLYTQGVVGLGLFVAFLIRLLVPLFACIRDRSAWSSFSLSLVLVAMFAVDETKIEFTRVYMYQMWIWALLGVAATGLRAGKTAPVMRELADG
jgi:hypothetical protein